MQSTARALKRGNLKLSPIRQMQQVFDNTTGTMRYAPVEVMRLHRKSKRNNNKFILV